LKFTTLLWHFAKADQLSQTQIFIEMENISLESILKISSHR